MILKNNRSSSPGLRRARRSFQTGLALAAWVSVFACAQESPLRYRVTFKNGQQLNGKLTATELTFQTPWGPFRVLSHDLSSIAFRGPRRETDQLQTIHRNRISGFTSGSIQLLDDAGTNHTIATRALRRIHRIEPDEPASRPRSQFMLLQNGDILSGQLRTNSVEIQIGGRPRIEELERVESIRFRDREVEILLRDGSEIRGELRSRTFPFQADLGPVFSLAPWELSALFCRPGFLPVSVRREFDHNITPTHQVPRTGPPFENFVWIPPGQFVMGSESSEAGRDSDEGPATEINLTEGFWMAQYEVTQAEYLEVMGSNPSMFRSDPQQPVEKVNWHEAVAYCRRITQLAGEENTLPEGFVFRLPTEAEWEYACRGGTLTRYSYGDDLSDSELGQYAWYVENSNSTPHPVGQLKPNPWGLYDMHGNVWEWCHDQWHYAYPGGRREDWVAPHEGWLRVARGGSWLYSASHCRSTNRDDYGPNNRCSDIGFRVVLAPPLVR